MELQLKRLDERRYETCITRSDGVTWLVKGVGHMGNLPHDLAHFVVERALGIRQGFWGSLAEGAVFGSLTHVEGRRKPHAAQRSRDVLRRNDKTMKESEILVGLFDQAMGEGLGASSPELRHRLDRYTWTPPGHPPRRISDQQIAAVCEGWARLRADWEALGVGETLELHWPEGR